MVLLFTSYNSSPGFTSPQSWLTRIAFYTGILEQLSQMHKVIAIEHIDYEGNLRHNGVRYIFLRMKKRVSRFPFSKHRLIKKLQPDVVFINGFIFPLQIIQLRLQLGKDVKFIILHRAEKPFNGYKAIMQTIADKFISAYFVSALELGESWMAGGIVNSKLKFREILQSSSIFSADDKSLAKKRLRHTAGPSFLWVGRLDQNKDPLTVTAAFIQYLKHKPDARFSMIFQGGDLETPLRNMIAEAGCSQMITLLGAITHRELADHFNAADFIVSGSHYEGSGIAVIEAMSCGCIPVVTNITSFNTITGGGQLGFLYEPGDKTALLGALMRTEDLDLKTEQERVKTYFKDELSFEAIARKTDQVIHSLFMKPGN